MKKINILVAISCLVGMAACNNSDTSTTSADSTTTLTPGPENVNGTVPDTVSTIQLNEKLPVDSLKKDSVPK